MFTNNRAPSHVAYSFNTRAGVPITGLSIDAARHIAAHSPGWSEIVSEPVPLSWWGADFGTSTPVRWRESFQDGRRYGKGRCAA